MTDPDMSIERLQTDLDAARVKIANLEEALVHARVIGAAIGIVMSAHKVDYDTAFTALVESSQRSHRKVYDVAERVLYTGDPTGLD